MILQSTKIFDQYQIVCLKNLMSSTYLFGLILPTSDYLSAPNTYFKILNCPYHLYFKKITAEELFYCGGGVLSGGGSGVVVCYGGGGGQSITIRCGRVAFSGKHFRFHVVVAAANCSKLLPNIRIQRVTYGCRYLDVRKAFLCVQIRMRILISVRHISVPNL